ncbi:tetratricopeptide repeat protein [Brachyspira sp.]|uniref:tetratricopeptide repeat protein n=1 Tax=Brachyspira sp. TaxID=1977261 RepID=UPI00261BF5A0|nr:tetratricopeptide repeat protein [Brachyspira sp.]
MKDRDIKSTIIILFLISIFLFALIYFVHAKNVERRFDKILENYTNHLQSIITNNTNTVINLDTKILESSMAEIMKNSNDVLSFWFAFLSVIMIVFTFAGIFTNNNILSESKGNLEYIEKLKKEMEESKYEAKKLIFDMDIETQKNINKQQYNINKFFKDVDKQYKETSYYIDKEKIHINDTMNSIKNKLEKLKFENEKAFDNINKIKDEHLKSIDNLKYKAEEETKKLIEENNRNIKISNLFNSGYQAYNNKEYNSCINYYTQIIEITDDLLKEYDENSEKYSKYKSNISNAYYNRGVAQEKLRDNEEAIKDYNKAIELNPNDSNAYNNRGNVKSDLGLYEEAIKDYNKAIELNPNYSNAYFNMVLAKQLLINNTKSKKERNELIKEAYNDLIKCYNLSDNISKKEYKQRIIDLAKQGYEAAIKICNEMGWEY